MVDQGLGPANQEKLAEHPGRNQGQEPRPPQGQQISGQDSVGFGINRLKGDAGVDKDIMASDSQGSEGKQAVNPIDANSFGYPSPLARTILMISASGRRFPTHCSWGYRARMVPSRSMTVSMDPGGIWVLATRVLR